MKSAYFFICSLIFSSCFSILDVEEKTIATIHTPNQKDKIRILYYPPDAISHPIIQIRRLKNDSAFLLKNHERYNYVQEYYFEDDSLFYIVLKDTSRDIDSKLDTFKVNIDFSSGGALGDYISTLGEDSQ